MVTRLVFCALLLLDAAMLGLRDGEMLRDLWRQQPAGSLQAGYTVRAPSHGVVLLGTT